MTELSVVIVKAKVICPAGHEFETNGDGLNLVESLPPGSDPPMPVWEAWCPECEKWV